MKPVRKIWVIGAEGLLGKAVFDACAQKGIWVVGTGRSDADITLKEMLTLKALEISPTHIINCAAYTDVDKAQKNYEKAWSVNALGAQNTAEVAFSIGARLIHISTDYVFDGTCPEPCVEEKHTEPVNAYGKSKSEGEKRVMNAHPDACIVRTSWLFGKGGGNFFSALISYLKAREELTVVHDQWGRITYAPDLAHALLDLLDEKGIFHFANDDRTSRFEVAQFAFEEMRRQNKEMACQNIIPVSKEAFSSDVPRPSHSILGTDKYTQLTGKRPREWKEAIREFMNDEE